MRENFYGRNQSNNFFQRMNASGGLCGLSENVLIYLCSYLTAKEVAACQRMNKSLNMQFKNDMVWQRLVNDELGMIWGLEAPPGENSSVPSTYEAMYKDWMISFHGYSASEIKMATVWWHRMESWLRLHAPFILATLNKPPKPDKFNELGWSVPRYVKLLYRFHDGQVFGVYDPPSHRNGLFGCYDFYDQFYNFYFVNLYTSGRLKPQIDSRFRLPSTSTPISTRCSSNRVLGARTVSSADQSNILEDSLYCTFADGCEASFPETTSFDLNYPNMFPKPVPNRSELFAWLYEYLHRLETGVYQYKNVQISETNARLCKAISLFPSRPLTGVYSDDKCFVRTVTNGIEVTASWIYVPDQSTIPEVLWTYSITLRLLTDHPSRPTHLARCRLLSRHWLIRDYNSMGTFTEETVDGDGVIGLFPQLSITDDPDNPFFYQSCMVCPGKHPKPHMSMSGHLVFENPDAPGRELRAYVDELHFTVPSIKY